MASSGKVLGTFSKGTAGAVTINFGVSGGVHCDIACIHHPDSTADGATFACYAVRTEKRPDRAQLLSKLARHEVTPPALICGQALVEIRRLVERGNPPTWIRFSTNGSLPQPGKASRLFLRQLRAVLAYAKQHGLPVHFPVESRRKAWFYRKHVGDLVVVRESLQSRQALSRTTGPVAFTAGCEVTTGRRLRHRRIEAARAAAKRRAEKTGRKCIVCPAVVVSFRHRSDRARTSKAKCGNCVACALSHIDVIYPLH